MKLPQELKKAISNLPSKEKDKLIYRLLKYDLDLANRLLFELVSQDTVEDRRIALKKELEGYIDRTTNFYSPGYLNMDIREMSGIINIRTRTDNERQTRRNQDEFVHIN